MQGQGDVTEHGRAHEGGDGGKGAAGLSSAWLGDTAERLVRPYVELLADRIDAASVGLRAAAQHIARDDEETPVADGLRRAGDQAAELAGCARDDDVERIFERTAEFARRRPALFLGASAAAGWMIARALQHQAGTATRAADESTPQDGQEPTNR